VTLSLDENEVKSNINEINNIIKNNKNIEKNEYEKDNLQNMNYEKKLIIQKKENKQLDEKNEDEDKKIENKIDENNNSNINITKNESEHIDIQDYNNDINQKDKKEAYRVSNINYNIYKEFNNNIIEDNKYRNKEKINKEITENNYGNNSEYDITEKERDNWVSFQDPVSLILNTTPENAPFERVVYNNQKLISLLHNDLLFKKGKDILDESITWYTMRARSY
jgi:hypothetical protein